MFININFRFYVYLLLVLSLGFTLLSSSSHAMNEEIHAECADARWGIWNGTIRLRRDFFYKEDGGLHTPESLYKTVQALHQNLVYYPYSEKNKHVVRSEYFHHLNEKAKKNLNLSGMYVKYNSDLYGPFKYTKPNVLSLIFDGRTIDDFSPVTCSEEAKGSDYYPYLRPTCSHRREAAWDKENPRNWLCGFCKQSIEKTPWGPLHGQELDLLCQMLKIDLSQRSLVATLNFQVTPLHHREKVATSYPINEEVLKCIQKNKKLPLLQHVPVFLLGSLEAAGIKTQSMGGGRYRYTRDEAEVSSKETYLSIKPEEFVAYLASVISSEEWNSLKDSREKLERPTGPTKTNEDVVLLSTEPTLSVLKTPEPEGDVILIPAPKTAEAIEEVKAEPAPKTPEPIEEIKTDLTPKTVELIEEVKAEPAPKTVELIEEVKDEPAPKTVELIEEVKADPAPKVLEPIKEVPPTLRLENTSPEKKAADTPAPASLINAANEFKKIPEPIANITSRMPPQVPAELLTKTIIAAKKKASTPPVSKSPQPQQKTLPPTGPKTPAQKAAEKRAAAAAAQGHVERQN